jgi:PPM family protein phosphatase
MALTLEYAVRSHVGLVRDNNEDRVFASPRLVAVADGVGGTAAGEVASRTAVNALAHFEKCHRSGPLPSALGEAVVAGNETISFIAQCRPHMAGMSTTLTAVALEDLYVIANVGDSRTYLYRDEALTQLTRDDSYVQMLIDHGHLGAEDARRHPQRSVVLQALDGDPNRRATIVTHPAQVGDRLLLCSDGLSDFVDVPALRFALAMPCRDRSADCLIEMALAAGGGDNVSVIIADVVQDDTSSAPV